MKTLPCLHFFLLHVGSMMVSAVETTKAGVKSKLPEPVPVSTTYASVDPIASAQWMVRYLGAELIDENVTKSSQSGGDDCGAQVAWVRLQQSGYEFHFVKNPNKVGTTTSDGQSFTPSDYVAYVDRIYGNVSKVNSSTYDVWMDFHVGMSVGNLTHIFRALHQGGQEFFFVGADSGEDAYYDLFVEIPGTGAILEFSSLVCSLPQGYSISPWDICQEASLEQQLRITSSLANDVNASTVGSFGSCDCDGCDDQAICWRKTTFAAPHAFIGLSFAMEFLGAQWTRQGHPGINIKHCATIAWGKFDNGYELHFVDGSSYASGPMTLEEFSSYLDDTRHSSVPDGVYDQFMDNHLTLWVEDLDPFLTLYDDKDVPYLLRAWPSSRNGSSVSQSRLLAILLNFPENGFVVELLSDSGGNGKKDTPTWDFCSGV